MKSSQEEKTVGFAQLCKPNLILTSLACAMSSYCNVYLQSTHAFRSYNTDKSRVEHCSKRSPQCEKSKYCRSESEKFSNVLSFIEFPIHQNYFVLCEIQFP